MNGSREIGVFPRVQVCIQSQIFFTITARTLARSLANFYHQYADRHMNLQFMRCVNERERPIRQLFCYRKKQIEVSF